MEEIRLSESKMSIPLANQLSQPYQPGEVLPLFQRFLANAVGTELVTATRQRFYQRLFLPLVVLWGFVFQRLNPDHTCDAAVSSFASGAADGLCPYLSKRMSDNTAGYCKARTRLPLELVKGALHHTARTLQTELDQTGLWHERRVCLLDGSTLQLAAEPVLVEHYGRSRNQHGKLHWPLLRLVAGFDLFTGAAEEIAEGPYRESEQSLAVTVIREAESGILWIGDRNFGVYRIVQVAHAHSADLLVRLNAQQAKALARHAQRRLASGDDGQITWIPSAKTIVEPGLSVAPLTGRLIYVRLERPGFRPIDLFLFTTLTNGASYPMVELVQLDARRWEVELDLRHIKTTMAMERLTGKSVDMVRKELWAGLLAYNLIRGLMGLAAHQAGLSPWVLSFARCWRRVFDTLCRPHHPDRSQVKVILDQLLIRLGQCRLPKRPEFRIEPRAVWGRPQPYPKIKGSRVEARQVVLAKMKS